MNERLTSAGLTLLFPQAKRLIDYQAGLGIFLRLMRDRGFDVCWYDRYASNHYACGFEHPAGEHYDFLTPFEVLEHLVEPIEELAAMMKLLGYIFVSTALLAWSGPSHFGLVVLHPRQQADVSFTHESLWVYWLLVLR